MKCKILPIIALLAVMVALTGAASATEISLLKSGQLLGEPILVKNNDQFNLSVRITLLLAPDQGTTYAIITQATTCSPTSNCNVTDIKLIPLKAFTATTVPTTTQDDTVRLEVNAPISRKPGMFVSYFVTYANPDRPAQASRTVMIKGSFISGKKCNDLDGNGICGTNEPGLPGWTIILRDENGTVVATTTTNSSGNYAFKGQQINITDNTGTIIGTDFLGFRGTFTVEEVPQAGWTQTGPAAPGTYGPFPVDANDITGLDFANTIQRATIILVKNTVGGDGTFNYTTTGGDGLPSSISVTTSGGTASKTFTNITPGTYSITEIGPTLPWILTSSSCTVGTPSSFVVPSGGTVTCTFINTLPEVGKPGKSIGWGDLGSSASFDYWIYSQFLPSGTMNFKDKVNKVEIKATKIDSINTTCNELNCTTWPKSATIKGMADVTENGAMKGNFAFTVNVEDKADPSHGQDTFSISVPGYKPLFMPSGYSMGGAVTFGNLKVIKTS